MLTTISFTGFFKKNINGGFGGKVMTNDGGDIVSEVCVMVEIGSSEDVFSS